MDGPRFYYRISNAPINIFTILTDAGVRIGRINEADAYMHACRLPTPAIPHVAIVKVEIVKRYEYNKPGFQ